jgi:hypothetical protein
MMASGNDFPKAAQIRRAFGVERETQFDANMALGAQRGRGAEGL